MSLPLSKGVYTELHPGGESTHREWASQEQGFSSPAAEGG